ncbi:MULTISPECIES: DUF1540 domain-containing protein [Streptomyces]|uniref:DUF1540 domain-containing protein n=1 Tax=Streptomyces TaxID=1883 RepID=UPI001D138328|nr:MULTISPECIES: DUF1540 domain-containing protein [Streptomyces]MCC3652250.1 DUF1540 domain-containing protein [Streptomyces sp. S07_1.15]WSQ73063.1 DUF1540 domain-containing protein [Streptomyces xinghaiensis]
MDMPIVNDCAATSCAYNRESTCHALAITVGDPGHAHCDTFIDSGARGGDMSSTGRVGACKMSECRHNDQLECRAPGITVGFQQNAADCLTYAPA